MQKSQVIIGIDEVGRGPFAGPVVVAAVRIRISNAKRKTQNSRGAKNNSAFSVYRSVFRGIRDSKKLSAKQREKWFAKLTAHRKISWAVARVYPKTIDRINISQAANLGALRVYRALSTNNESVTNKRMMRSSTNNKYIVSERMRIRKFVKNSLFVDNARIRTFGRDSLFVDETVLLDGGLRLPAHIHHKTIIRGDEKIPVIAAASIIAKVTRDRIMTRLHKKYPKYRFDIHKGYGTILHRAMIKKYGRSEIHRKSFHFRNQE